MSAAQPDITSLNGLLADSALPILSNDQLAKFHTYLDLILKWNARTNLTAVRDREGIIRRHFFECVTCSHFLPTGLTSLLDLGSGAGFPGIPIAICRPELAVTLVESQNKKAAFLNEVVRSLNLNATVSYGRADRLSASFDCVTLRAVDSMASAIASGLTLLADGGWIVVLTTETEWKGFVSVSDARTCWRDPIAIPHSAQRVLAIGSRIVPRGTVSPRMGS